MGNTYSSSPQIKLLFRFISLFQLSLSFASSLWIIVASNWFLNIYFAISTDRLAFVVSWCQNFHVIPCQEWLKPPSYTEMLAEEGVHPPNRVRIEPPPTHSFPWGTYQKEQSCWSSSWLLGEILEPHSVRAGRCHRGCLSYCFILWGGNWGPEKGSNLLTEMLCFQPRLERILSTYLLFLVADSVQAGTSFPTSKKS